MYLTIFDTALVCNKIRNKKVFLLGGAVTSQPDPEPDPSFVVEGPSAPLVVSLATVFLILTLASVIVAFILYRRR